jgi:hypothetical protein
MRTNRLLTRCTTTAILIYLCTFLFEGKHGGFPRRELWAEMTPEPKMAIGQDLQDLQDYSKRGTKDRQLT